MTVNRKAHLVLPMNSMSSGEKHPNLWKMSCLLSIVNKFSRNWDSYSLGKAVGRAKSQHFIFCTMLQNLLTRKKFSYVYKYLSCTCVQ